MQLITIRQACERLQVCRNTLLAMIADGRVKARDMRRPGAKHALWRIEADGLGENLEDRVKLREIEKRIGL